MDEASRGADERPVTDSPVAEARVWLGEARRRVWAADTACYYAHRRLVQSGAEADRAVWQERNEESEAAHAALREAEAELAQAATLAR
jgi:hypothetical protein